MTPAMMTCMSCKFWFADRTLGFHVGQCVRADSSAMTRAGSSCGEWKPRRARVALDPARAWHPSPGNQYSNPAAKAG